MYNPNVPSSNMGIAPVSSAPSQPLGPTPMVGSAPMGPMGPPPPMMGGMPPPPMMAPPPMAPPIAPITEGLGGFGGSSAGRAGFSERMQRMTAPPKPMPQPVQRMNMGGAVSSQGLSMYQPPMMPRSMGMMGGVPNRVEPLKMALGGFIGNSTTRDYSDDDPFGTDDLLDSLGIPDFDPNKDFGGGGDDSGGDDDDYYNYLDDNYVYTPPPAPAPPVVVPEPEPESGDNIQDRVIADLVYSSAEPTVGSSDPSVPDVAPDFGTFTDLIDSYGSLTGQVVSPTVSAAPKAIDAVGAAPIVGAGESGEGEGASTEVDVLGVNPISLSSSGITDGFITDRFKGRTPREMIAAGPLLNNPNDVNVDISNIPAVDSDFTARRAGEILDSLNVARPGGSSKTRIEDAGLANAMAAAQAGSNEINALGSDAYTGVFEPEFVEPTPAEVMASNRRAMAEARADDAANVQPQTFVGGFNQYPDPSDIQFEMAPSTDGGYQPNLRRGPFGPIGPESSFPGDGRVDSLAVPADQVFPQASAEQIGGGLAGASTRPGMGSDDPIVYNDTPSGTRRNSDGRTVSGIAPSPAPAVIRPQNTKYLSPFDISELENLEKDYYRTGAGSSDYDPMAAQATAEALKRAEGDVSALDRIAEARMPTDDMQIVDDMRSVPRSSPEFAAPVGDLAQFEPQVRAASSQPATADPDGSGTEVDDVDIFGGNFNRDQFTDREFYKNREDLYSLFGPSKGAEIFNSAVKSLSMGLIDLDKLSAKQREKALEAYLETGKLAYNKDGKLIGVEDPDGRAILLGPQPPKDEDNIGGDDDGCPPGFRRINGVCMPIRQNRVAANPATAISDSINKATLPSTLRPVVRDVVDDDDEEEASDVGGLTIRRPNYFAGGGAVSEGMGSAIDSFISAMGGNVKKKSNVEPVNMQKGGAVSNFLSDFSSWQERNKGDQSWADYHSSYGTQHQHNERGRQARERIRNNEFGIDLDPVAPSNPDASNFTLSGSGPYFESEPEPDNIVKRSLRPQLRPASFVPEPVEPVEPVVPQVSPVQLDSMQFQTSALPATPTRPIRANVDAVQSVVDLGINKSFKPSEVTDMYGLTQSPLTMLGLMEPSQRFGYNPARVMSQAEQDNYNKLRKSAEVLLKQRIASGDASPDTNVNFVLDDTTRPSDSAVTLDEYAKYTEALIPNYRAKNLISNLTDRQGNVDLTKGIAAGIFTEDGTTSANAHYLDENYGADRFKKYMNRYAGPAQTNYFTLPVGQGGYDDTRPALALGTKDTDVAMHELGHGGMNVLKKYLAKKNVESPNFSESDFKGIREPKSNVDYEYGPNTYDVFFDDTGSLNLPGYLNKKDFFRKPTSDEGYTQYFDDTTVPGYYTRPGVFSKGVTKPELQQPFQDYYRGEPILEFPVDTSNYYGNVVKDGEFKGQTISPDNIDAFLASEGRRLDAENIETLGYKRPEYLVPMSQRLEDEGLIGLLHAISDAQAEKMGVDPYAYRSSQGLKINPSMAPISKGIVRSARPRLRPQKNPYVYQGLGSR